MSVLYLREEDVQVLLSMHDALVAVERAFQALGTGDAINGPRRRIQLPHSMLNVMPAGWAARGYLGFKYYTVGSQGIRFWVHLLDANTGALLAVMQANRLGQQRTGAASGVATKFLSRADSSSVGIIGTGWQAESQLEAVCGVRPIRRVRCYSRDRARRLTFAKAMSSRLGIDVAAADSAKEAVQKAEVVVAATVSSDPVVLGKWLEPGTHVNAMGANRIEARELDDDAIRRSTLLTVDSVEQAKLEAGDLVQPIEKGLLSWERVREICDVVSGKGRGRTADDEITVFKSLGIAIEDVAAAALVYEKAREEHVGMELPL
jgi:ornithine cyclodeaminase/alanine dehydrogenase-like protein (mu-crystallin family)